MIRTVVGCLQMKCEQVAIELKEAGEKRWALEKEQSELQKQLDHHQENLAQAHDTLAHTQVQFLGFRVFRGGFAGVSWGSR